MFRSLRNRLILSHILPALLIIPLMGVAMVYVLETRLLLPIVYENLAKEANLMAEVLKRDYGLAPKWVDNAAETTRGNAQMAAKDLLSAGIERVVLVTTAIHMPRSKQAFEAVGFTVIPAATDYTAQRPFTLDQLVPSTGALRVSYYALREWISRAWYRVLGS